MSRSKFNGKLDTLTSEGEQLFTSGKILEAYEKLQQHIAEINEEAKSGEKIWKNMVNLSEEINAQTKKELELQNKLRAAIEVEKSLKEELEKAQKLQNKEREAEIEHQLELLEHQTKLNKLKLKGEQDYEKAVGKFAREQEEREAKAKNKKAIQDTAKSEMQYGLANIANGGIKDLVSGIKAYLNPTGEQGRGAFRASMDKLIAGIADLSKKLTKTIDEIAEYKEDWDTRLFGSSSSHSSVVDAISNAVGTSPFVKQANVMKNLDKAIDDGIAYNVEQRAFLQTIKEGIADTFDAFDGTLLNIIRVQQSDSTAARLGMEASLNELLNSMYSNTEYLSKVSDNVTSSLYEATSLMTSAESIGFEYQVQKWLGSLYSVGMSSESVQGIAGALGKLASGDVSGTDNGFGRLLVMAASRGGLDYSDMLTKGLDGSQMNTLMSAMVTYLEEIANSNKVVQQQYANVFGLKTSDIVAAGNIANDIAKIAGAGSNYNYGSGIANLNRMASTLGSRMSLAGMMTNLKDNFAYSLASGIADNPVLYSLWTMSNMMDDLMGGVNIPTVMAFGTGVDLEATMADLIKVGALSASVMGGLGGLVNGLGDVFTGNQAAGILQRLGINSNISTITRGAGLSASSAEVAYSTTSYVGNSSGSDIYNSSLASADEQKKLSVKAPEEETVDLNTINTTLSAIYDLWNSLTDGRRLRVITQKEELLG